MNYSLHTPEEISQILAIRLKELRLLKRLKRSTLAERSGVTQASLKRFEQTGKVSMENFLKLVMALGRLDEMETLLRPARARSIQELELQEKKTPRRGSI
ncbi:MAG: helix-turn-helix domain-containing protein [Desulfobacterium sp.]|jgi:transcriptional regulator with XRE-family HTH domain|nr:helix-turn-helix domain-containing protein [Desulfobacterium sp.]